MTEEKFKNWEGNIKVHIRYKKQGFMKEKFKNWEGNIKVQGTKSKVSWKRNSKTERAILKYKVQKARFHEREIRKLRGQY